MDVVVTGEMGALGRAAVPALIGAGHRVRGLSRYRRQIAPLRKLGAEPGRADLCSPGLLPHPIAGCDPLLPMATCLPSIGPIVTGVRGRTGRYGPKRASLSGLTTS